MKKKKKGGAAGAGRAGNVTEYDLGEKVDQALRGLGGPGLGNRPGMGHRPGGYRFRPGALAGRFGNRWELGAALRIPGNLKPRDVIGGGLLGVGAQKLLRRLTPLAIGPQGKLLETNSALVVDGVNFIVGAIPFIAKPNDLTVGVALPGLFQFGGNLVDLLLDFTGLVKPQLAGPGKQRQVSAGNAGNGGNAANAAQRQAAALRQMAGQARAAGQVAARQPAFAGSIHPVA